MLMSYKADINIYWIQILCVVNYHLMKLYVMTVIYSTPIFYVVWYV